MKTARAGQAKTAKTSKADTRAKLLVHGARGRVGTLLTQLLEHDPEWSALYRVSDGTPDLIIDFSSPEGSLAAAELAKRTGAALLVGTTGLSDAQMKKLEGTLKGNAWAHAPNTSLGVFALTTALRALDRLLPASMEAAIYEVHHAAKKDAPSGTAKLLAQALKRPVQISSARGGSEVGEHRVIFFGQGERIELVHNASNRVLFAHGALRLGQRLLASRKRGRHTLEELYE